MPGLQVHKFAYLLLPSISEIQTSKILDSGKEGDYRQKSAIQSLGKNELGPRLEKENRPRQVALGFF